MPKRSIAPVNQPLSVKVERGKLVIEIGVRTLAHCVSFSDWANPYDEQRRDYFRTFAIVDPEQFVSDVAHEMQREEEDGSSPVTTFLDKMMEEAINEGSMGIAEEEQHIKYGACSPLETWAEPAAVVAVDPVGEKVTG